MGEGNIFAKLNYLYRRTLPYWVRKLIWWFNSYSCRRCRIFKYFNFYTHLETFDRGLRAGWKCEITPWIYFPLSVSEVSDITTLWTHTYFGAPFYRIHGPFFCTIPAAHCVTPYICIFSEVNLKKSPLCRKCLCIPCTWKSLFISIYLNDSVS
jgi:hypothetical protein